MTNTNYEASRDSEGKPYVRGPRDGLSYYGGTLWPELRFSDDENAESAAAVANTAYKEGYKQAQADFRKAIGL